MIGRLLCKLGLHSYVSWDDWEPAFDARIVTRWEHVDCCVRCRLIHRHVARFDPVTGAPIPEKAEGLASC